MMNNIYYSICLIVGIEIISQRNEVMDSSHEKIFFVVEIEDLWGIFHGALGCLFL